MIASTVFALRLLQAAANDTLTNFTNITSDTNATNITNGTDLSEGTNNATDYNGTTFDDDDGFSNEEETNSSEAYEFVAFLLWYLFLVLCCVIPTCCAYRRRRLLEARMEEQQAHLTRWQQTNLMLLQNYHNTSSNDTAQVMAQRTQLLERGLEKTTMVVTESDLEEKTSSEFFSAGEIANDDESSDNADGVPAIGPASTPGTSSAFEEYDVEQAEQSGVLRLPRNTNESSSRKVAGVCAICLGAYQEGEQVSWSPQEHCPHAFHKDCIINWLSKKDSAKCPVCRQEFCEIQEPTASTGAGSRAASTEPYLGVFSYSRAHFSPALELSLLELQNSAARSNNENSNNNESTSTNNHHTDQAVSEAPEDAAATTTSTTTDSLRVETSPERPDEERDP